MSLQILVLGKLIVLNWLRIKQLVHKHVLLEITICLFFLQLFFNWQSTFLQFYNGENNIVQCILLKHIVQYKSLTHFFTSCYILSYCYIL